MDMDGFTRVSPPSLSPYLPRFLLLIEKRRILLPDLVLFVNHLFLNYHAVVLLGLVLEGKGRRGEERGRERVLVRVQNLSIICFSPIAIILIFEKQKENEYVNKQCF